MENIVDGTWVFTHGDCWFTGCYTDDYKNDGKIVLLLINRVWLESMAYTFEFNPNDGS